MRNVMRSAVGVLAMGAVVSGVGIAAYSAASPAPVEAERADLRQADYLLVKIHADWCPKCQAQNKHYEHAMGQFLGDKDLLFVKLDITDPKARAHSEMLANELGLGDIWEKHSKRTGQMFLVERNSKRIVENFGFGDSSESISATIASNLN